MCPRKHAAPLPVSIKLSALLLFIKKPASGSKVTPTWAASAVPVSQRKSKGHRSLQGDARGLPPRPPNARTAPHIPAGARQPRGPPSASTPLPATAWKTSSAMRSDQPTGTGLGDQQLSVPPPAPRAPAFLPGPPPGGLPPRLCVRHTDPCKNSRDELAALQPAWPVAPSASTSSAPWGSAQRHLKPQDSTRVCHTHS